MTVHSQEQQHPYHLVDPSPWPITGAFSALVMFAGTVGWMHDTVGAGWVAILGLVGVLATMFMWWRDVIREAEHEGHHTPVVQLSMRYGMALFIASEVMFFAAFFWAFFNASLFPFADGIAGKGVWPPAGVTVFNPFDLPFLNTLILLTSGATVTWAHHGLKAGNRGVLIKGLALTILLGLTFTGIQAFEYSSAPFAFDDGIYPSTFFMATGFHGFHVIIGTTFLIVCLVRAIKGHFKPEHHFGFEAAAWYWHFVDVIWLFLFSCIYWWGSGNAPMVG